MIKVGLELAVGVYMKSIACVLLLLASFSVKADFVRKDLTVLEVGLSTVSGRVFVVATPLATNTECVNTSYYAMKAGSPESFLFYSAALTAMNEGKKLRVQYETMGCLGDAPKVDVFWNLNQ